jgi:hypothetical protein
LKLKPKLKLSKHSDTIDITDLIEKTRSAFVDWAVLYLYGLEIAVPGLQWVALPIIKDLNLAIIRAIVDALSKAPVMQGFFLNTALRKATQATGFIEATNHLADLPENVDDETYTKAEAARMDAFRNFVVLTN